MSIHDLKRGATTTGLVAILFAVAIVAFGVLALLLNISERKAESSLTHFRVVDIDDETTDPAVWGQNFPLHYEGYASTVDMERTAYGGSEALPREPTEDDPRTVVSRSKLELIPQLKRLWAGYAFAVDYRQARGHAYALEDQTFTGRQRVVQQPGTCMQCHASSYVAMMKLGEGDLYKGFDMINQKPYQEALKHVEFPVTCIDCHEPETMALRITRPSFMEGVKAWKASQGEPDYDLANATRQEMRSFVCGQCHVEYYFSGPNKNLVFPWAKGLKAEEQLEYFEESGFVDWTHAETGTPMLKVQHPEFELWSQSVHAASGVSCADCHMPYQRVGAKKISNHHVRSPLLDVNAACQTCHNRPEEALIEWVETTQGKHEELTKAALDAVLDLIDDIVAAKEAGATDAQLERARSFHRKASWYVDFVDAENSTGFHAPQEGARLLGEAINHARLGQSALREDVR
ncbi:MAG: ammonia-forming cytochrome c nitrite reductase subunit c552 [Myxococcota bacterium]|nr:ammonia-forming cytochrome c nitrite reductase subunit c552 [Myxococcota bacterium]